MPKPSKGPRLGAGPAHERKILANLAKSLIEHRSIRTTEAKARRLQPYIEKLITKAKKGDIHNRRMVARKLSTQVDKYTRGFDAVYTLFDEVVPDPKCSRPRTRLISLNSRRNPKRLKRPKKLLRKRQSKLRTPAKRTRKLKKLKTRTKRQILKNSSLHLSVTS